MTLARITWPKAGQDIKLLCKECLQCLKNKISEQTKPATSQFNDGIPRCIHIHLDTVGPLSAVTVSANYFYRQNGLGHNLYHKAQVML